MTARNPDPNSTLPYLLRLPIGDGLVFRTKDTWPRTNALYCHPVPASEWPDQAEIVEGVALRACTRRGAAIDVVADRGREQRSQLVFTNARGREMVFWQSPRTRKQARPDVRLPTARAAGIDELEIVVDAQRYPYTFAGQQVRTARRGLSCGDYAVTFDGTLVAAVERKTLADLVSSLTSGRLRFVLAELAALPRAAVVVEDRYSRIFALERVRPRLSPMAWPSCRSGGPRSPSCSARRASCPRSGPTGTSPLPTPGRRANCPPFAASASAIRKRRAGRLDLLRPQARSERGSSQWVDRFGPRPASTRGPRGLAEGQRSLNAVRHVLPPDPL